MGSPERKSTGAIVKVEATTIDLFVHDLLGKARPHYLSSETVSNEVRTNPDLGPIVHGGVFYASRSEDLLDDRDMQLFMEGINFALKSLIINAEIGTSDQTFLDELSAGLDSTPS